MQLLNSVAVGLVSVCLMACSEKSNQGDAVGGVTSATSSDKGVIVETASPDQAVKSWWRYLHALDSDAISSCKRGQTDASAARLKDLEQIAGNQVLAAYSERAVCVRDSFERTIDEVRTESETRALVFASIKNVTPVPAGAEPDEYALKSREEGEKFKYLVEKLSGAWKISQVYKHNESARLLKKEVWEKVYEPSKPYFPSYVPPAQ